MRNFKKCILSLSGLIFIISGLVYPNIPGILLYLMIIRLIILQHVCCVILFINATSAVSIISYHFPAAVEAADLQIIVPFG